MFVPKLQIKVIEKWDREWARANGREPVEYNLLWMGFEPFFSSGEVTTTPCTAPTLWRGTDPPTRPGSPVIPSSSRRSPPSWSLSTTCWTRPSPSTTSTGGRYFCSARPATSSLTSWSEWRRFQSNCLSYIRRRETRPKSKPIKFLSLWTPLLRLLYTIRIQIY